MNRFLPLIALLAAIAAGGAWVFSQQSESAAGLITPALAESETTDAGEILHDHVLGDPDAPVTLIEYASYTCGHCANFHLNQAKRLKEEYVDTGKVKFIHREVYWDQFALRAGLLAACGGEMRYHGISGLLYEQQRDWIGSGEPDEIVENLVTLGKVAGLSEADARACMDLENNDMVGKLITTFQHHAEADGIRATPTLVINGEVHMNMDYDDLKVLIDAKLAE